MQLRQKMTMALFTAACSMGAVMWSGIAAPALSAEAGLEEPADPRRIRGNLEHAGPDFVMVDGRRFHLAPRVQVKDEEGGAVPDGLNALKPQMEVALTLEDNRVVQITIFGLLAR